MAPSKSPEWCPEHEHRSGGRAKWGRSLVVEEEEVRSAGGGGTNSEIRIKKAAAADRGAAKP